MPPKRLLVQYASSPMPSIFFGGADTSRSSLAAFCSRSKVDSRPSDDASSLALLTTALKQSKKFPVWRRRCLGTSNIAGHGVGGGRMAIVPLRFNERMIHQQGRAL